MENKDYKLGQANTQRRGPGGPGGPSGEKAKDLVGTWKKLFGYCRKYVAVVVIALICAAAGTVLTLMGPDKLSDMTDTITDGIKHIQHTVRQRQKHSLTFFRSRTRKLRQHLLKYRLICLCDIRRGHNSRGFFIDAGLVVDIDSYTVDHR